MSAILPSFRPIAVALSQVMIALAYALERRKDHNDEIV